MMTEYIGNMCCDDSIDDELYELLENEVEWYEMNPGEKVTARAELVKNFEFSTELVYGSPNKESDLQYSKTEVDGQKYYYIHETGGCFWGFKG